MKILGHRGACHAFAENTVASMLGAVAEGADGVELDVMRCASGELVLCHDEWLDRLAGIHLQVSSAPFSRLQRIKVGGPLGFKEESIPTLQEVLEALPRDFLVNVELKCDRLNDDGLSRDLAKLLLGRGDTERILVTSFNPFCLLRFRSVAPFLRRGLLIDPDRNAWLQNSLWQRFVGGSNVHPPAQACNPSQVLRWHRRHLAIGAWTVDDAGEALRLRNLGVELIISNRPGPLRRELAQRIR